MNLATRRRIRGIMLSILLAVGLSAAGLVAASPASAGVINCGTQAVELDSMSARFYYSTDCYNGWILMVPGDIVRSSHGGSVQIGPRTACHWNYWSDPSVIHTTSNSNYGAPIYLTFPYSGAMRDCWNF